MSNTATGIATARLPRDTALVVLALLMALASLFGMLYAVRASTASDVAGHLVVAVLVSGASAMLGGLLGFLFGIPRSLQGEPSGGASPRPDASREATPTYRPNTSLEQISDWLTKILVGVGLTQLTAVPRRFATLSHELGRAFGGQPVDDAFVGSLIAMLLIGGFLFGFLWTRIYLPSALRAADLEAVRGEVREELGRQADADAEVLNLVEQQLGQAPVKGDELVAAIKRASSNARLFVFERAREHRSKNWQDPSTKATMAKSIPVFRALIESGVASPISHRYYGQLGFALKDQAPPDWKAAEAALTTAIDLRGKPEDFGYTYYELNRALCRIMLDEASREKRASGAPAKDAIVADLRVACQSGLLDIVRRDKTLVQWAELNQVADEVLGRQPPPP